jgi:hypothetical protein
MGKNEVCSLKHLASTNEPVLPSITCSTLNAWTPELFEEITDLMAEVLFQDFQEHRRATVESPRGPNHKISLTRQDDWNK